MINTMFVLYEQIKPDDAFGKMMIKNLKSRNIELKGIYQFPELEDQKKRFIDYGWQDATAIDINTVHDKCTSKEELARYVPQMYTNRVKYKTTFQNCENRNLG